MAAQSLKYLFQIAQSFAHSNIADDLVAVGALGVAGM